MTARSYMLRIRENCPGNPWPGLRVGCFVHTESDNKLHRVTRILDEYHTTIDGDYLIVRAVPSCLKASEIPARQFARMLVAEYRQVIK